MPLLPRVTQAKGVRRKVSSFRSMPSRALSSPPILNHSRQNSSQWWRSLPSIPAATVVIRRGCVVILCSVLVLISLSLSLSSAAIARNNHHPKRQTSRSLAQISNLRKRMIEPKLFVPDLSLCFCHGENGRCIHEKDPSADHDIMSDTQRWAQIRRRRRFYDYDEPPSTQHNHVVMDDDDDINNSSLFICLVLHSTRTFRFEEGSSVAWNMTVVYSPRWEGNNSFPVMIKTGTLQENDDRNKEFVQNGMISNSTNATNVHSLSSSTTVSIQDARRIRIPIVFPDDGNNHKESDVHDSNSPVPDDEEGESDAYSFVSSKSESQQYREWEDKTTSSEQQPIQNGDGNNNNKHVISNRSERHDPRIWHHDALPKVFLNITGRLQQQQLRMAPVLKASQSNKKSKSKRADDYELPSVGWTFHMSFESTLNDDDDGTKDGTRDEKQYSAQDEEGTDDWFTFYYAPLYDQIREWPYSTWILIGLSFLLALSTMGVVGSCVYGFYQFWTSDEQTYCEELGHRQSRCDHPFRYHHDVAHTCHTNSTEAGTSHRRSSSKVLLPPHSNQSTQVETIVKVFESVCSSK